MVGLSMSRRLRSAAAPTARALRRQVLPHLFPPRGRRMSPDARAARIVGLLSSATGLGMSARLCALQLEAAGCDVTSADVAALFDAADGLPVPGRPPTTVAPLSIYHLNPTMLLPGILRSGPLAWWRSAAIGYWAWELESLPPEWIRSLAVLDAVLVPSRFCKAAVERHTTKPVLVVPHPVDLLRPRPARPGRDPSRPFRVVSVFNLGSSFTRKNPLAAIAAFRRAFPAGEAELVLKIGDGDRHPADKARLVAASAGAPDIRLIDRIMSEKELDGLLASADACLSLHRSEGFGLTLAEAIAAQVPVVATDWSGNRDFCRPDLAYAVEARLVPATDRHSSFAGFDAGRWAEPSVEQAAGHLRAIFDAPEAAARRAEALRAHLSAYLAEATYPAALARLAAARDGRAGPVVAPLGARSRG